MKHANAAVRFFLELAALAGLAYWGATLSGTAVSVVVAICAPAAAAVVWGAFVSPKARLPARDPWRLLLELAVFGSGAAGFALGGVEWMAIALAVAAALHLALTYPLDQRTA